MIIPFLEGEQSRTLKRTTNLTLVGALLLGTGLIAYVQGQRQTTNCVERKISEMNEKRKLRGNPELKLPEIQNLTQHCRGSFYRSLIGL